VVWFVAGWLAAPVQTQHTSFFSVAPGALHLEKKKLSMT